MYTLSEQVASESEVRRQDAAYLMNGAIAPYIHKGGVPTQLIVHLPYVPLTDFPNHLGQDIDVLKNQRIIGQKNTPRITKECN